MPNFKELGFKAGPSFFWLKLSFPTPIVNKDFKLCRNTIFGRSWKWIILPNKRRTNLETNSSKLGTSEVQNSFILAYQTPFWKISIFERVCPPLELDMAPWLVGKAVAMWWLAFGIGYNHVNRVWVPPPTWQSLRAPQKSANTFAHHVWQCWFQIAYWMQPSWRSNIYIFTSIL